MCQKLFYEIRTAGESSVEWCQMPMLQARRGACFNQRSNGALDALRSATPVLGEGAGREGRRHAGGLSRGRGAPRGIHSTRQAGDCEH